METEYWPSLEVYLKTAADRAEANPDEIREYDFTLSQIWATCLRLREAHIKATGKDWDGKRRAA